MIKITGYLYSITFIFDRYHCSWAAGAPDEYECDSKYLTYTFVKSKIPRKGEINEQSFSDFNPGLNIFTL